MTALVTGSTGFLGKHLVTSLLDDGIEVVAVTHVEEWVLSHKRGTLVRGDVRDLEFLRAVISRYEVDTVYHLAAQTQVTTAHGNPADTFDVNVRGTWTVLEACRLERVKRVVVASSDKVYGECENADEKAPHAGWCPYSSSKVCADKIARTFGTNYDTPVAIARCGNLYGPGDTNWRRLIPGAIRAVLQRKTYVLRTDGIGIRDYLYIDDAVAAYKLLGNQDYPMNVGPFNFSGGEPRATFNVFTLIEGLILPSGQSMKLEIGTDQTELKCQTLCCDKAAKLLGWRPTVAMVQGLDRTIEWYRSNV